MSSKKECPICVQNMNKTTRAPIMCPDPECGFECCRECMKEYIVTQRHDPKCMSCSKAFSRMYLQEIMPTTWIKGTFTRERESILMEREKSMIPDTMPWVEAESEARKQETVIRELAEKATALREQIAAIHGEINARNQNITLLREGQISEKSRTKRFIVKCPECPAFVNKDGKCSSCSTRICMHCRDKLVLREGQSGTVDDIMIIEPPAPVQDGEDAQERITEDNPEHPDHREDVQYHKCDADTLATARMIETDTKPCPKCGNRIHKIEGCDQMFDPHCGTAFSWRTGQIVTGIIHNPHYFQWQRENNGAVRRTPGDVLCGGPPGSIDILDTLGWVPNSWEWIRVFKSRKGLMHPGCTKTMDDVNLQFCEDMLSRFRLCQTGRILMHIQNVELPSLQTNWDQTTNRTSRIKYVMNELSEEQFRRDLAHKERMMEKNREIQQVFDTFLQAGTDILRKFLAEFTGFVHNAPINSASPFFKKTMPLTTMMALRGSINEQWWVTRGTIKYRTRMVDPSHMRVPTNEIVRATYQEMKALENYCNEEFCKISKSWKLVTPCINIDNDVVEQRRWYAGK